MILGDTPLEITHPGHNPPATKNTPGGNPRLGVLTLITDSRRGLQTLILTLILTEPTGRELSEN